jgi:hypothetical protein
MIVSLIFFLSCIFDWLLLSALPRLQLSFSSSLRLPLAASFAIRLLILTALVGALLLHRLRRRSRPGQVQSRVPIVLFLVANLGFGMVQVYAYAVEPLLVETTELALAFDDLDPAVPPVRVIQIADLLPFYGPVVTFSRYGRRHASGLFRVGGTTLVVSRGLGSEGMGLPRVRFLCWPELVSLELAGIGQ